MNTQERKLTFTWCARARRVKCDEQKPVCKRCRDSRRKCGGYEDRGETPDPSGSERQSTPTLGASAGRRRSSARHQAEQDALDFFCQHTLPGLDAYFPTDFWSRTVLAMSRAEPAIHHAMVAVGSAHSTQQRLALRGDTGAGDDDAETMGDIEAINEQFTLVQYNKAIQALNNKLTAKGPRAVEVVLICCVLFVCLEALNRYFERAMRHIESGCKIFNDWARRVGLSPAGFAPEPVDEDMRRNLWRVYVRLHHQVLMITGSQCWSDEIIGWGGYPDPALAGMNPLHDLGEAQDAMDGLSKLVFQFLQASREHRQSPSSQAPAAIAAQRAQLSDALHGFDESLNGLAVSSAAAMPDPRSLQNFAVLRTQIAILKIMLSEPTGAIAMPAEPHLSDCTTVVAQCELALQGFPAHPSSPETPLILPQGTDLASARYTPRAPIFALASGIPSALYLVTQTCRSPSVRQQALDLLKASNMDDGIWSTTVAARIAEKSMDTAPSRAFLAPEPNLGLLELGRRLSVFDAFGDDDDEEGSNLAPSRGEPALS